MAEELVEIMDKWMEFGRNGDAIHPSRNFADPINGVFEIDQGFAEVIAGLASGAQCSPPSLMSRARSSARPLPIDPKIDIRVIHRWSASSGPVMASAPALPLIPLVAAPLRADQLIGHPRAKPLPTVQTGPLDLAVYEKAHHTTPACISSPPLPVVVVQGRKMPPCDGRISDRTHLF
jgi:hypothetical protein